MAGLPALDVPAYYCYALVLLVGGAVAWSMVNQLAGFPDRWAFAGTWQLFIAHLLLPVLLFWFLDFVSVIQDTSLFAALVVGAGYRQIFSGGVQGLTLPAQTASLWKPFDAWVKSVADRIATKQKQYRDQFDARTQLDVSYDPNLLTALEELTIGRSQAPAELQAQLQALLPNADMQKIRILWRDLRASEPGSYGYLLYKKKIISYMRYWWWLRKGCAKGVSAAAILASCAVAFLLWQQLLAPSRVNFSAFGPFVVAQEIPNDTEIFRFYQWRALKTNVSDRDRYRTEEFLYKVDPIC
jgi:hypothetical protein